MGKAVKRVTNTYILLFSLNNRECRSIIHSDSLHIIIILLQVTAIWVCFFYCPFRTESWFNHSRVFGY